MHHSCCISAKAENWFAFRLRANIPRVGSADDLFHIHSTNHAQVAGLPIERANRFERWFSFNDKDGPISQLWPQPQESLRGTPSHTDGDSVRRHGSSNAVHPVLLCESTSLARCGGYVKGTSRRRDFHELFRGYLDSALKAGDDLGVQNQHVRLP